MDSKALGQASPSGVLGYTVSYMHSILQSSFDRRLSEEGTYGYVRLVPNSFCSENEYIVFLKKSCAFAG